ncbi:MAG: GNAT family N-acetyltransferase [Methyloligellaceae bacterium]
MIRKYNNTDIEAVVTSWYKASRLAHPFLSEEFLTKEESNLRNIYLSFAETWVQEIDGKVIGFISLIENEIGGLFLDPEYHGKGFGRGLTDKAVAEKGPLKVEVFKENKIGQHFYKSYGFIKSGEFIHEASGQATITMTYSPE